jgi:oxygen-dependent protoporphyrinogen oxidase
VRTAIIGGGIAGLAAAWELSSSGAEVAVYEPSHLGGKLVTSEFLGRPVDEGPDSLLARVPEGVALCAELGLDDELVPPSASKALVCYDGELRPLPGGLILGVPAGMWPLARSGFLSPAGLARAALDLALPARAVGDDESLWHLVASRFGREVADRLVEPLVGSIYAGWTRGLSAAIAAPQLLAAAKANRSLLLALRKAARNTRGSSGSNTGGATGPVFVAPRGGMQAIADGLVARLKAAYVAFIPLEVNALLRDGHAVSVEPAGERYDGVVIAVPAPGAKSLLAGLAVEMGQLGQLPFASVGIVTLAIPEGSLPVPAHASGLLVAPPSELLMTACSFGSNKWPHWAGTGTTILRVSVGKAGDERWSALSDEELAGRVLGEVAGVLMGAQTGRRQRPGTAASQRPADISPIAWRVSRWPGALPQYPVGHLQRVAALRDQLHRQAPTVALAGASYGRVGVPACIASGRQAAVSVRNAVGSKNGGRLAPAGEHMVGHDHGRG